MGIRPGQVELAAAVQRKAAADAETRVRLVAGPGTGKSFTIEDRVCWLLDRGADPANLVGVSFTRASAFDLQRRVRRACVLAGHADAEVAVTTLHSLALRSLRAAGALAAYPVDPVVLDGWELDNIFDEEFGSTAGIGSLTRRRDIREDHEAFCSTGEHDPRPAQQPPDPPITDVERGQFQAFHIPRTQLYGCVLPGELVQRCVALMDARTLDPVDLLTIEHLIVDEFQDLNPMDLRFVYGLESAGATSFVAGDDDQSLYSFRFASPEGIQQFTEEFDSVGDHILRDCFRCTPAVLGAAETLIASFAAPGRIPKQHVSLYAESDPPVPGGFGCWRFENDTDEARAIASSCRRLIDAGLEPREIMVLVSNARVLAWQLADAFDGLGVPCELPRTEPFKDTQIGRALLTALRIVTRPDDYVALRALMKLRRGTGVKTAADIADTAIQQNLNYGDLLREPLPEGVFTGRALSGLEALRDIVEELSLWGAEETLEQRLDELNGIVSRILNNGTEVQLLEELDELPSEATLAEVLAFVRTDKEDERAEVLVNVHARLGVELTPEQALPDAVRIMTMHGAKGLSATVVFIPGLEDEILPGAKRARYAGQVLEAARMLYVSITRARVGCVVSYTQERFMHGQVTEPTPSRYTSHLGCEFRDMDEEGMTANAARLAVEAAHTL